MSFAGTLIETNQTQLEHIKSKENVNINLTFQLTSEYKSTPFVIEIRLCDAGKYRSVCRCRWVNQTNGICKTQTSVSVCKADKAEVSLSLQLKRTYSDVVWELLQEKFSPVILKRTKLQVIGNCSFIDYGVQN